MTTIRNFLRREPVAVLFVLMLTADAGLAAAEDGLSGVSIARAVILAAVGAVTRYLVTPVADPAITVDGSRVPLTADV